MRVERLACPEASAVPRPPDDTPILVWLGAGSPEQIDFMNGASALDGGTHGAPWMGLSGHQLVAAIGRHWGYVALPSAPRKNFHPAAAAGGMQVSLQQVLRGSSKAGAELVAYQFEVVFPAPARAHSAESLGEAPSPLK